MMHCQAFGITDVGRRRRHNEDAFIIDHERKLFAVADGIGGAAAGEVASALFVESCIDVFQHDDHLSAPDKVHKAYLTANLAITSHSHSNPKTKGMGCTAELFTIEGDRYFIGHVGDSRTYLIRNNQLSQLTRDHSYIQDQMDKGLLSPEEAKTHWLRNAINRAVGQGDKFQTDILSAPWQAGDCFLLCSDGLTDMLNHQEIADICVIHTTLRERTEALVNAANEKGGNDNITVLLCQL
ncbi:MAG: Stp1/IreP family PP2C-type Ser/Thr phosphatase, partial [Gammaproteobacteria bacterium]|nr:Stp1/IreP family PP2C-type Ser/Thr phosphatase [Gammaproteobacteria bacterium]